jgi:hypothetical protein
MLLQNFPPFLEDPIMPSGSLECGHIWEMNGRAASRAFRGSFFYGESGASCGKFLIPRKRYERKTVRCFPNWRIEAAGKVGYLCYS